ncbi:energy transducer TonB, partial [Paucibacter sp. XJ19-41]|uniref:energy transducer TonB n=1 Tax=Paucibacter sp. XJ19-41 TaxID=2927824 RepID=UPI00234AA407
EAAAPPAPALPPAERLSLSGLQSNWQGRVLERLAEFRRYPAGARSRREQGVSHVRLRVNRAGQLLQVRLELSSGHTELDRAALATVRAAVPLPAIPPELPDELELLLPVEFFIR